jgi:hypothetical protein
MSREDEIGKDIEAVLDAGIKVGIPPHAPIKIVYGMQDWRLIVRALQDAYRSHEFQRINGEKNTRIEELEREVRVLTDKLSHAEKRLNI